MKAQETLSIIERGTYINKNDDCVNVKNVIEDARNRSVYFSSESLEELIHELEFRKEYNTKIEVVHEDSISCVLRLARENETDVMCLNFASAKNPGGGFLNGALAQEESLAVSSSLYDCQMNAFEFYETHRNMKSCIYTDGMIYSPNVPVFRNNKGELLDTFVPVDFITSAAVNTGVVVRREPEKATLIQAIMEKRIEKMLSLCIKHNNKTLVLGAWGCGVFQNDPEVIAQLFFEQLNGKFKNKFKRVVFAIYSRNEKFIKAFEKVFLS